MRRAATCVLILVLALAFTACGEDDNATEAVRRVLAGVEGRSRQYIYRDASAGFNLEVRGLVEDSFRHQETLKIDGSEVLVRVVSDDALALQVGNPAALAQLTTAVGPAADALRSGHWVIDPFGAPAQVASSATVPDADPIKQLDSALQMTRYLQQIAGGSIRLFNPDEVGYIRSQDPFPHPNREQGEARYDLVPPPLPARSVNQQLPTTTHFRRMSFFAKNGKLLRVLEKISIDDHPDVMRARETGRNKTLLSTVEAIKAGQGPEKIRERAMAWEIESVGEPVSVSVPAEAVQGDLKAIFAPAAPAAPAIPGAPPAEPPPAEQPAA